jgi:Zn-dependent M28 family amino/carboxypeptidase
MTMLLLAASCGGNEPLPGYPEGVYADPRVVAAIGRVSSNELNAHLQRLLGPREIVQSQAHHDEVAQYITQTLQQYGYSVLSQPIAAVGGSATNILGERPGADPSRVVVFGAHYDTVPGSPGADDNATGVAALLTIAHAIAGIPTYATIRFVAFDSEEQQMAGSAAYVQTLGTSGPRLEIALTVDMIGFRTTAPNSQRWPNGASFLAQGREIPTVGDFIGAIWLDDTPPDVVNRFNTAAAYLGAEINVQTLVIPRFLVGMAPDVMRSDHASFWRAGLPAISIGDSGPFRNPNYHQPTDTMQTLDLGFLTSVTRWLAAALMVCAQPA